jgi:hypothetical protein
MTLRATALSIAGALCLLGSMAPLPAQAGPASSIPSAALVSPAVLAARLRSANLPKPLVLQVGFRVLFDQAHIPGSEFVGPAKQDSGLALLRARVAQLPRDAPIVIYCGCCPWSRCPNIAAAYDALRALGFTHVLALHIRTDFGTDWVKHGYPVTTGAAAESSHGG